ncbi:hypothetical protein [Streptomyces sp. NPDC059564]|uniref:hypothetical protein n=1 Tax=Streptomyces sp. NPDC059564 TaxID=3346865 RepID=UPI0036763984
MSPTAFDWLQTADRHTELIDPVISVRQLARLDLRRKRLTRFDHCLVYATKQGEYVVFRPPHRPRATSRYSAVYEVDMGLHPVRAGLSLPSSNDALEFQADVDLRWRVSDPVRFVGSGLRDVPRLLLEELEQSARGISRHHSVTDSAIAEAELLKAATAWTPLGACAGLKASWTLRLHRNQEAIDHEIRMQGIQHQNSEQILGHVLGEQADAAEERRRAALLRLRAEKIELYQEHLEEGGVKALAWYLSQHPEDTQLVMANLRADQQSLVTAQLQLVTKLFDKAEAETHELAEPRRHAFRTLNEVLTQRLPGSTASAEPEVTDESPSRDLPPGYGRTPVEPGRE